jgi:glycosyltransferase involved in cell wall biosynthesis
MKVCFVTGVFPPDAYGGVQKYVLDVATELQERGHDVLVLTTRPAEGLESLFPTYEEYEGIEVVRFFPLNIAHQSTYEELGLPGQALWRLVDTANPFPAAVVHRTLAREAPDVVHVNEVRGLSTLVTRSIRRLDVRYVYTLHDYALICPNSSYRDPEANLPGSVGDTPCVCKLFSICQGAALGSPDLVLGPSQYILDIHRRHGFFGDVPCRRLQHGIRKTADSPPPVPEEPRVLFVGRLEEKKGALTLIEAAERLPSIRFDACGDGPLRETVEAADAKLSNLSYHGFISDERLRELRRRATVSLVPSEWPETSGLVVFESLTEGIPVVASDIGGISEIVVDGQTGVLFEPADTDSLVSAVETAVNPSLNADMRENALSWADEHRMETHVDALEAYYRD